MRHPFDGVNEPAGSTRRGVLGMLAAAAGYFGVSAAANAAAPPGNRVQVFEPSPEPSTEALREEGGAATKARPPAEAGGKPPILTNAIGEDGGGKVTTLAVGEEGGASTRAVGEEGAATKALREAGGGPIMTTKAIGEEGGRATEALKEAGGKPMPPVATTLAVGEEGAGK
jgi:hypothetical protein